MSDELPPLPADLSAYIDRFDGAEYGLVMIAIKRYAAAAVARERAMWKPLCVEIEANMRREWDARRLPAECWPTDLAQRLVAAIRGGD